MKLAAILSSVLAIAVPIHAADYKNFSGPADFTFNIPAVISGAPTPSMAITVNLTGLTPSTFAGMGLSKPKDLSPEQYQVLSAAIAKQLPDYLDTYKGAMNLDSCDLTCCEEACFALLLLPFFTLVCSKSAPFQLSMLIDGGRSHRDTNKPLADKISPVIQSRSASSASV